MEKENEVYLRLSCEPGVKMELNQYFRFRPKNFQFMPMYRRKKWDGYVYLFNLDSGKIYYGLKIEYNVLRMTENINLLIKQMIQLNIYPMKII